MYITHTSGRHCPRHYSSFEPRRRLDYSASIPAVSSQNKKFRSVQIMSVGGNKEFLFQDSSFFDELPKGSILWGRWIPGRNGYKVCSRSRIWMTLVRGSPVKRNCVAFRFNGFMTGRFKVLNGHSQWDLRGSEGMVRYPIGICQYRQ